MAPYWFKHFYLFHKKDFNNLNHVSKYLSRLDFLSNFLFDFRFYSTSLKYFLHSINVVDGFLLSKSSLNRSSSYAFWNVISCESVLNLWLLSNHISVNWDIGSKKSFGNESNKNQINDGLLKTERIKPTSPKIGIFYL